ncbi:MAG: orotate phosphoribosyltransferase [Proteobacteria bacterium]|nr:orotate phosphoribosyltransferase [Pseudomonadota bacterium]
MREKLLNIIKELGYEKKKVILASGRESDFYVDLRNVTLHPEGLYLTSNIMFEILKKEFSEVEAVGGPTLGADPIIAGLIYQSYLKNSPLMGFIIRKEPKKHGLSKMIEGDKNLNNLKKVVIIEDVVTTGESSYKAYNIALSSGFDVLGILAILDRDEGADEFFREKGIKFISIFKRDDILK